MTEIAGWMSKDELAWLTEQARDCETILELGSYHGRSTQALLDGTDAHLWCVDTWEGSKGNDVTDHDYEVFLRSIADVLERVTIMRMSTQFASPHLAFYPASFDLIFIDADHDYNAVKADILAYAALVKPGGILCGHDYGNPRWPGVQQAVDETLGCVKLVETIWWTRLGD